jgi:hypothetical protein
MKVSAYFATLGAMKDSHEPGVILLMRDGSILVGVARCEAYGSGDPAPNGASAWFSLDMLLPRNSNYSGMMSNLLQPQTDIVIDIHAVVAVIPR